MWAKVLFIDEGNSKPEDPTNKARFLKDWGHHLFRRSSPSNNYKSTPQQSLKNRRIHLSEGKGLGGSTLVNAGIYQRGREEDYSNWIWSLDFIEEGFASIENDLNLELYGCSDFGKLIFNCLESEQLRQIKLESKPNWTKKGMKSEICLVSRNGKRVSAWETFLKPIQHLPNLTILVQSKATKLILLDKKVVGIELVQTKFPQKTFQKERKKVVLKFLNSSTEVILSCGAINSPKLLMLSGIGPKKLIESFDISLESDEPEIGKNLRDHLLVPFAYLSKPINASKGTKSSGQSFFCGSWEDSINNDLMPFQIIFVNSNNGLKSIPYFASISGMHTRGGGILSTALIFLTRVVLQIFIFFTPFAYILKNTLQVLVVLSGPKSCGSVRICSSDPFVEALVDPGYLSASEDITAFEEICTLFRKHCSTIKAKNVFNREILPGMLYKDRKDRNNFQNFVEDYGTSYYHLCGSCSLGKVLKEDLTVKGIANLRVADASIIPNIPSAPIQAACMMIGDRMANILMKERMKT